MNTKYPTPGTYLPIVLIVAFLFVVAIMTNSCANELKARENARPVWHRGDRPTCPVCGSGMDAIWNDWAASRDDMFISCPKCHYMYHARLAQNAEAAP